MRFAKWLILLILSASLSSLFAHHAMEFIQMESYNTAPQGGFVFHLHYDYLIDDPDQPNLDHWEFTPGLSYGVSDRLMLDAHGHFAKFGAGHLLPEQTAAFPTLGPSPFMEALALAVQYRVTKHSPLEVGLALTFEQPLPRSVDLIGGQQVLESSLIINHSFGEHRNILLNLNAGLDGDEVTTDWGLGLRTPLTPDAHGISAGVEILGNYAGDITFLPGIYFPLGMQDIVFKTGLEFNPGSGVIRSNLTLLYQF